MRHPNQKNVVMIADDDLFIRKIISKALEGLADIVEVTDGAKVVEAYQQHMPDVVFLDIHLPNMMGLDLIDPIYAVDPKAFIVMVSADSSSDNVAKIKEHGAKAFLTKPFDKARVISTFNKCPTIKFMDF